MNPMRIGILTPWRVLLISIAGRDHPKNSSTKSKSLMMACTESYLISPTDQPRIPMLLRKLEMNKIREKIVIIGSSISSLSSIMLQPFSESKTSIAIIIQITSFQDQKASWTNLLSAEITRSTTLEWSLCLLYRWYHPCKVFIMPHSR